MAKTSAELPAADSADFCQCEYVPFGAEDKIKLSFNLILRWLAVKTAKGAVPGNQDVMKFLMTCKAKRLNPFDGDAFLIGYDGKDGPVFSTIVAHQSFLKRAETHPEFDGMESGVIVRIGDNLHELVGDFFPQGAVLVGGWATVFFVNRRHPMTKRLRLQTFDKGRSLWKSNPEGMIVKCAEADALRSSFPQLIGGMYLREEMESGVTGRGAAAPLSLTDGRGEEIPFPAANGARERAFADRAGNSVAGRRTQRYEQDPAAAEVQERLREKPLPVGVPAEQARREDLEDTAESGPTFQGIYSELLARCAGSNTFDAIRMLEKEVAAHLTAGVITDEESCDLNGVLANRADLLS